MGDEIPHSVFTQQEQDEFQRRLQDETETLGRWFEEARFSQRVPVGGFELEAWLVDEGGHPAACNDAFLQRLNNPLVVPELSRFNVELNGHPQTLQGECLGALERELGATWQQCGRVATDMGIRLVMIGILPTVAEAELTLRNMSELKRYRALNEQVLTMRGGKPLRLEIRGHETLKTEHDDVMLESATTSFQIHLKVGLSSALRCYNAAKLVSAPMVAVSANSPYLFGKDLWEETRIPLFEQSVAVGGFAGAAQGPVRRVSFGTGYARNSLMECFTENAAHFPVLLPTLFDDDATLPHLRLHNGTIWRWNRPLLGFDDDGTPHLRIEHRVVPGGPTVADEIANAAFFFGLVKALSTEVEPPEQRLAFSDARDNFYAAARDGLDAQIKWLDGNKVPMPQLLRERLLPLAELGLQQLGVDPAQRQHYLDILRQRIDKGCTGARWQRAFVAKHGPDMAVLTEAYWRHQESGRPVHEWDI